MNTRLAPFVILALGICLLGAGIALRFHAADLGAMAIAGMAGIDWSHMYGPGGTGASAQSPISRNMLLAQHSNAAYDVALTLLWTGGALIVLAAVTLLFLPAWRPDRRAVESPAESLAHKGAGASN
jgi:hypothetical protein